MRVYLNDTLQASHVFTDEAGEPLDITGGTVTFFVGTAEHPATIADPATGTASVTLPMTEAGAFSTRWRLDLDGIVRTETGENVTVYDPDSMWASLAQMEAVTGPQPDPDRATDALIAAQLIITSLVPVDIPDPPPADIVLATILLAQAMVDVQPAGTPIAETIGDYSYRLATGGSGLNAWLAEVRRLLLPWLGGNLRAVRIWPEVPGLVPCCEPTGSAPDPYYIGSPTHPWPGSEQ